MARPVPDGESPRVGVRARSKWSGWSTGLLDIPHGCLEQGCCGLGAPNVDIDLVVKLAGQYCGCENFCRITRAESDFGIEVEAV